MRRNNNGVLLRLLDYEILESLALDLKLQRTPVIYFTDDTEVQPMDSCGNCILINLKELKKAQDWYEKKCHSLHAAFDATMNMIMRECYHIYQSENGIIRNDSKADTYILSSCSSHKRQWMTMYMITKRTGEKKASRYFKKLMIHGYKHSF